MKILKELVKKTIKNEYTKRNLIYYRNKYILYSKFYIRNFYNLMHKDNMKLKYPEVLQFPITNKCNLDCIMCNIHENNSKDELTKEEISRILQDPIFKNIKSVGINGGEPFILNNIAELVETTITALPSLKNLFIITNGTIPTCIDKIEKIKKICEKKKINFTLSFSIDGYGKVHDEIRGKDGSFEKLMDTLDKILKNKKNYCDSLNFICTLSKKNIYYVNELEAFSNKMGITISYNIATEHERFKNKNKYQSYSLFSDPIAKMLAREFLYCKFRETLSKKYYALYKYLEKEKPKRCADCQYLHNAITLTSNGDICYCATHSKVLTNIKNKMVNIENIYFSNEEYNNEIKKNYCETCSHYIEELTSDGYRLYINEVLKANKKPME